MTFVAMERGETMDDMISRQAAIDMKGLLEDWTGKEYEAVLVEDIEQLPSAQPYTIHSDGRLWVTVDDIDKVNAVVVDESKSKFCKQFYMDAQPEIIYCKDCKHRDPEDKKCDCGHDIQWQLPRQDDWFCADAERREVTT